MANNDMVNGIQRDYEAEMEKGGSINQAKPNPTQTIATADSLIQFNPAWSWSRPITKYLHPTPIFMGTW
jgi:hypothetical protein